MKDFNKLGNIQIGKDYVLFSINPKIHNFKTIKRAAKEIFKEASVIFDGDKTEVLVELRPRKGKLEDIAQKFADLLIKCS